VYKIFLSHFSSWDTKREIFVEMGDFPIADTVRVAAWAGRRLCVGYRKAYVLIDTADGTVTELFPTGKSGTPAAVALPSQELLLGKDNIGIFIGHDGKPTRTFGLSWQEPPIALGYSHPYVLALLPRGLEVSLVGGGGGGGGGGGDVGGGGSDPSSAASSSSSTAGGASSSSSSSTSSSSSSRDQTVQIVQTVQAQFDRIATTPHAVYGCSANSVTRLIPVPVEGQVDELVSRKCYQEALRLSSMIQGKVPGGERKDEIHELFAVHLFGQARFTAAMDHFLLAGTDPRAVIALLPELLSRNLRGRIQAVGPVRDLGREGYQAALEAIVVYLKRVRRGLPGFSGSVCSFFF
jgi:hypothetical protein